MKCIIILFLLIPFTSFAQYSTFQSIDKVVSASTTAESLTASPTQAFNALIKAKSTNTATVSIGRSDSQEFDLAAGDEVFLESKDGMDIDLSKIYVEATQDGDGVNVIYGKQTSQP